MSMTPRISLHHLCAADMSVKSVRSQAGEFSPILVSVMYLALLFPEDLD